MAVILIVDDEPMCRELMDRLLRLEGHEPVTASNGEDALAAVAAHNPDLILLDLMMPLMDGWTFLGLLRANPRWRHLPVIVLTAVADQDKLAAARAMDVRDCVVKAQFSVEKLLAEIARHLAHTPPSRARVA